MSTTRQNEMLSYLKGKTVAILAYNEQGYEHAIALKEHGIHVTIGLRQDSNWEKWFKKWSSDGFEVMTIWDAIDDADVIQVW